MWKKVTIQSKKQVFAASGRPGDQNTPKNLEMEKHDLL